MDIDILDINQLLSKKLTSSLNIIDKGFLLTSLSIKEETEYNCDGVIRSYIIDYVLNDLIKDTIKVSPERPEFNYRVNCIVEEIVNRINQGWI